MAKNTPRVQICTRVQIAHMSEALGLSIGKVKTVDISEHLQPVT